MPGGPFKKGDPRINRAGRPKTGQALTDILRAMGDVKIETEEGTIIERKSAIAKKLWDMAMGGDVAALKYVYDRIDGSPIATTNIISDDLPQIVIVERADVDS